MVASVLRVALLTGLFLVEIGQVASAGAPGPPSTGAPHGEGDRPQETTVIADRLAVFDQPDEASFGTGVLRRGDRVRLRGRPEAGWAAIDPPSTAIGWVERGSLELGDRTGERGPSASPTGALQRQLGPVARSSARLILPLVVFGSSSANSTIRGNL